MDVILSDFLQRTNADPALAQDLLEATEWDLDAAVQAYEGLKDTQAVTPQEYTYNPSECVCVCVCVCVGGGGGGGGGGGRGGRPTSQAGKEVPIRMCMCK